MNQHKNKASSSTVVCPQAVSTSPFLHTVHKYILYINSKNTVQCYNIQNVLKKNLSERACSRVALCTNSSEQ